MLTIKTKANFNSRMVRLKELKTMTRYNKLKNFNSRMVRLKVSTPFLNIYG